MTTLTVRQAALDDLEALVPLFDGYRQFYGRASDPSAAREFLLARFNHGQSALFVAHVDDMPVGFTQLYPSFSSVSLARVFVLNDLFVQEDRRRKGVASKLISAATELPTQRRSPSTNLPAGNAMNSSMSTISPSRADRE